MAARPIAAGTVSFGLVSIPVKLYSTADTSEKVSFNMLHAACKTRLKQQYVCPKDGEIVPRDQMVKGYEFAKEQYVLFTEEEIKSMQEESNKAIEIAEFVPLDKVDPLYFDGAYYLGPDKGGERAYRLLAEAMRKTGRAALARWTSKGKQYLMLVRPVAGGRGLIMQQLHYADEIRSIEEVPIGDADIREMELNLGVQLIEQIATNEFKPDKYRDEVRDRMQSAIKRKIEGQDVIASTVEEPKAQIIDLMEALKASLGSRAAAPAPAASDASPSGPVAVPDLVDDDRRPAQRAPRAAGEAKPKKVAKS